MKLRYAAAAFSLFAALGWMAPAQAHCDTLDGPVVGAARQALDKGNLNLALVWVKQAGEPELRAAFDKARRQEIAELQFYETLVRLHRAGEGAPYDGIKPAGHIEPAVAAADRALATGKLQPVAKMIEERVAHGLHEHFDAARAKRNYAADDVAAGRAYVEAYVEYVHYVEKLHDAAGPAAPAPHAH